MNKVFQRVVAVVVCSFVAVVWIPMVAEGGYALLANGSAQKDSNAELEREEAELERINKESDLIKAETDRRLAETDRKLAELERQLLEFTQLQFEWGIQCYKDKDYSMAFENFSYAAESEHAEAQAMVGYMYERGEGVSQNYTEAVRWYRKAAEQGVELAQLFLGNMYVAGIGVEQDLSEAEKWYRLAAAQGNNDAQKMLNDIKAYKRKQKRAKTLEFLGALVNLADTISNPQSNRQSQPRNTNVKSSSYSSGEKEYKDCLRCQGSGKIMCRNCNGRGGGYKTPSLGSSYGYGAGTRTSNSQRWEECRQCRGRGKVTCDNCGGSGKVER